MTFTITNSQYLFAFPTKLSAPRRCQFDLEIATLFSLWPVATTSGQVKNSFIDGHGTHGTHQFTMNACNYVSAV